MSNILAIILILTSVTFLYAKENNNLHESAPGMGIQYASERSTYIKIVDPGGNGDYRTIKDAVSDSRPGWTILVKNGTYNRKLNFTTSGTAANPITVKPYLGHKPVLDFSNSPDEYPRVEVNARHIIVEGFEIRNGWDGIKVYKDNAVIRNNYIHDNEYQGILEVHADDLLIEYNRIENNGVSPGQCIMDGVSSPRHCHGIYFSNWGCKSPTSRSKVLYNHIKGHGGSAVQFNGLHEGIGVCPDSFTGNIISNNRFENNGAGMNLYYKVDGNTITYNEFVTQEVPNTDEHSPSFLSVWGSENNVIENNIFNSTTSGIYGLEIHDGTSANNQLDKNLWKLKQNRWMWKGGWRDDWKNYKAVTGWGKNSVFQSDRRTGSFNSVKQLQ